MFDHPPRPELPDDQVKMLQLIMQHPEFQQLLLQQMQGRQPQQSPQQPSARPPEVR